ncbi:hypothetical protein JS528_00390 [Bifidobacterium sp. MA2]|uniref:Uncharacterized protein n=1 Tax=Bifidobacterium santillanense TaxID=2809028 RepID=A0ABS5ULQ8_9BIFI|nr:hypothetical protein [Bifidobacterium santillanense]MBT1171839.1 hypothetical protein [Bifidobacterium santillanense]
MGNQQNISGHPSENARLIHFRESVDLYDKFKTMLLDFNGSIPLGADTRIQDDPKVMKLALRAALLRKYWAKREELRLDRVIDALQQVLIDADLTESDYCRILSQIKVWFFSQYPEVQDGVKAVDHTGNEIEYEGSHDLVREDLYGLLLHGDYQKWLNASSSGSLSAIALGADVEGLEARIHTVNTILIKLFEEGQFEPDLERIVADTPSRRALKL